MSARLNYKKIIEYGQTSHVHSSLINHQIGSPSYKLKEQHRNNDLRLSFVSHQHPLNFVCLDVKPFCWAFVLRKSYLERRILFDGVTPHTGQIHLRQSIGLYEFFGKNNAFKEKD